MTCREEIDAQFAAKSRRELLDYVCKRIDYDEQELCKFYERVGKLLA